MEINWSQEIDSENIKKIVVVKNAFDPSESENSDTFFREIEEDFRDELESSYGQIDKITIFVIKKIVSIPILNIRRLIQRE